MISSSLQVKQEMQHFLLRLSPFLGLFVLLSFLWLLYWSWCWGWWGRDNLFLQYLFQCRCPSISEQARFPAPAQVLVSACTGETSKKSQLSDLVKAGYIGSYYVFNNWVLERRPNRETNQFDYNLVNVIGNQQISLKRTTPSGDFEIDQETLTLLDSAQKVYLVQESQVAVALARSFESAQQGNIILEGAPSRQNEISSILKRNNIPYDLSSSHGPVSFNHLFTYIFGIYLTANLQRIVDGSEIGSRFLPVGWASDDRGVLLEGSNSLYLYGGGFQVVIPTGPVVPQPILLLRVPNEYLPPPVRQQVEGQMQQEQSVRTLGNISVWVSLALVLVLVGQMILRRFRYAV